MSAAAWPSSGRYSVCAKPAPQGGIYFLLVRLRTPVVLTIARRTARFPAAFYVYVGSAQRSLASRIARHRRSEKTIHWHIDHLLAHGKVVAVRVLPGAGRDQESKSAQAWLRCAQFIPMQGFGASDSPAPTHLFGFRSLRAVHACPLWRCAEALD